MAIKKRCQYAHFQREEKYREEFDEVKSRFFHFEKLKNTLEISLTYILSEPLWLGKKASFAFFSAGKCHGCLGICNSQLMEIEQ